MYRKNADWAGAVIGIVTVIVLIAVMYIRATAAAPTQYCTRQVVMNATPGYWSIHTTRVGGVTRVSSYYMPADTTFFCDKWIDNDGYEVDENGVRVPVFIPHKAAERTER